METVSAGSVMERWSQKKEVSCIWTRHTLLSGLCMTFFYSRGLGSHILFDHWSSCTGLNFHLVKFSGQVYAKTAWAASHPAVC